MIVCWFNNPSFVFLFLAAASTCLFSTTHAQTSITAPSCVTASTTSIVIDYNNPNNESGDWIGLLPTQSLSIHGVPDLPQRNWVWSCGTQSCGNFPKQGPITFSGMDWSHANAYVAVLARYSNGDAALYRGVATSNVIRVQATCNGPDPTPPPPTPTPPPPSPTPPPPTPTPPPPTPTQQAPTPTPPPPTPTPPPPTPTQPAPTPTPPPPTPTPPPPTPTPPPPTPTPPPPSDVTTDKLSYQFGEEFTVLFDLPPGVAERGDWIGIYNSNQPLDDLHTAHFWIWAHCGRQGNLNNCPTISSEEITFREGRDIAWGSTWPLMPGSYKAVLLRNTNDSPWPAVRVSPDFEIVRPTEMGKPAVDLLRKEIEEIIIGPGGDIKLAAKFLRLGFHDCTGGCDGCVDLTFIDNRGLLDPMDTLQPIADKYSDLFSRADVFAMSVLVGCDVSQPGRGRVDFDFLEWGRIDCENAGHVECFNEHGELQPCTRDFGPHREIPGINTGTEEVYDFFAREYDMDEDETVAIMGGHTIGELDRANSGVDGPHGWLLNNRLLDNEWYLELIGGRDEDSDMESLINNAPNWVRHFEENTDLEDFPDQHVWVGLPEGREGRAIIMLNSDIALFRELGPGTMDPDTGEVNCAFVTRDNTRDERCPAIRSAIRQGARYKFDNDLWLEDFEKVIRRMVMNGYRRLDDSPACRDGVCPLELIPGFPNHRVRREV